MWVCKMSPPLISEFGYRAQLRFTEVHGKIYDPTKARRNHGNVLFYYDAYMDDAVMAPKEHEMLLCIQEQMLNETNPTNTPRFFLQLFP